MARTSASSRPLTDHNEIRRWAEERGASPACVRGTGDNNDIGMIRLDFPGYSGEGKLEEISWGEWFDKFDESGLALLVQDKTARGQRSNFNKLVSRETAGLSGAGASKNSRNQKSGRRSSGENGDLVSAGYSEDVSDSSGDDLELEEVDVEIEASQPVRRSVASKSRSQKRQSGAKRATTARGSSRSSSVRGASSQEGRSRKQKSRSTSSKKGRTTGAARAKAKKAPGRATATSRATRGRSSGRRRAA